MIVNATEFKNKVGKYLELINKEEVIISRNGKQVAKLIPIDKPQTPNVDNLLDLLGKANKPANEFDKEQINEERFKEYESLTWYKYNFGCDFAETAFLQICSWYFKVIRCWRDWILYYFKQHNRYFLYIKKVFYNIDDRKKAVQYILQMIDIVSVTKTDIIKSFGLEYTDFEDALQTQCAKKIKATYIVTRNKKDFKDRSIKVVTPEEFLQIIL